MGALGEMAMRINSSDRRTKEQEGPMAKVLCVLAILFAAAAPFLSARAPLQTTPADEICGSLLAVALIILVIERTG